MKPRKTVPINRIIHQIDMFSRFAAHSTRAFARFSDQSESNLRACYATQANAYGLAAASLAATIGIAEYVPTK